MNKRRVCCFCEKWESGGIESFLHNTLMHMDLTAMEVDIVAAKLSDSIFTAPLKEKGVQFFELSGNPNNLVVNHSKFRRLLKEREYDVVHVNAFHGLSLKYLDLARKANVPVRIAHSHNTGLRDSRTKKLKMVLHVVGRSLYEDFATHIWACSWKAAEFLYSKEMLIEDGYGFIPNGIDTEKFRFSDEARSSARKELGLADELLVGTVGRLCQEKNQEFLLDVFAEIHKKEPNSRLLLVGDGDRRDLLHKKAKELNVEPFVIFYGATNVVEKALCAMDVFVFPSFMEALGISAVEAQTSGLPVLCSDCIPNEARLTDTLEALPLSAGAEVWAEAALRMAKTEKERTDDADAVKSASFDVKDTAKLIESVYLECGYGRP